ncbi:non-specific lipid transfer protein GPI-anchored 2-like [Typha latifolia]|uniref:non-specific lipid transfer protein GPI-anchored 2-like n=1 Tax=Typha latifolia TaxID=4733 RepID=UPI003C2ABE33
MDFITDRNSSLPSACCPRLADVVQTRPLCLCHVLNGDVSEQIGRPVDKQRALALPKICRVHTPSENECKTSPIPPLFPTTPPQAPPLVSPSSGVYGSPPAPDVIASDGSHAQWKFPLFVVYSIFYRKKMIAAVTEAMSLLLA